MITSSEPLDECVAVGNRSSSESDSTLAHGVRQEADEEPTGGVVMTVLPRLYTWGEVLPVEPEAKKTGRSKPRR